MSRTKIQSVAPGTPAHQAGVRPGETLLAINGHPIVDVGSGRWSCPRTWGRTWG